MKKLAVLSICIAALSLPVLGSDTPKTSVPPARAMRMLVEGNHRFVTGKATGARRSMSHRARVAKSQAPFAVIVACSDSRVSPELLFDTGLGELFVTRLAGAIVDDAAIGSIEYAVAKLGARLIVVVGHERCGAVEAAVKGGELPGKIGVLAEAIKPSVEKVRSKRGNILHNAVIQNVHDTAQKLSEESSILREQIEAGKVKVVGGVYDLDDGTVIFHK